MNNDIRYIINWFELLMEQKVALEEQIQLFSSEQTSEQGVCPLEDACFVCLAYGRTVHDEGLDFQAVMEENLDSIRERLMENHDNTKDFIVSIAPAARNTSFMYFARNALKIFCSPRSISLKQIKRR